jgi:hypothetical protein
MANPTKSVITASNKSFCRGRKGTRKGGRDDDDDDDFTG